MSLSDTPLLQCQADGALSSKASESCVNRLYMSSVYSEAQVSSTPNALQMRLPHLGTKEFLMQKLTSSCGMCRRRSQK